MNQEPDYLEDDLGISDNTDFLNVYMIYYKKLFNVNPNTNMFTGVDYNELDSTNRSMEYLYDHMNRFNEATGTDKDLICEPDDLDPSKCSEIYLLMVDGTPVKTCQLLIPLLSYISTLEWNNIEWTVVPLLTNDQQ